uniref:Uncharacterized protein n=1 Tax=uncultured bacterium contig00087 TaxID=1181560 RepID=A0A806KKQ1_9BACT|nr:hypothetical protein [uncultured bacterium contig00087]
MPRFYFLKKNGYLQNPTYGLQKAVSFKKKENQKNGKKKCPKYEF